MGRVDGGVVVVPGYEYWGSFHCDGRRSCKEATLDAIPVLYER